MENNYLKFNYFSLNILPGLLGAKTRLINRWSIQWTKTNNCLIVTDVNIMQNTGMQKYYFQHN